MSFEAHKTLSISQRPTHKLLAAKFKSFYQNCKTYVTYYSSFWRIFLIHPKKGMKYNLTRSTPIGVLTTNISLAHMKVYRLALPCIREILM